MIDMKEILGDIISGKPVNIPNAFYQQLLEQFLERDYLSDTANMSFKNIEGKKTVHWMRITRLPVHPNEAEEYDLLTRWQGVLTSLHAWGYRLYFLLQRNDGQTKLFMGVSTDRQAITADEAIEQMREAAFASMPGIGLHMMPDRGEILDEITTPLLSMQAIGAITGIPSFRNGQDQNKKTELLQTLDQLAFGVRDSHGDEKNYALLVIADPINDNEIANIIGRYRQLGSEIHTGVRTTVGASKSTSYNPNGRKIATMNAAGTAIGAVGATIGSLVGSSLGGPLGAIAGKAIGGIGVSGGALIGGQVANAITASLQKQVTDSNNVGLEYLDKFAQYAEAATDHHVERLNSGRNYGFWNTGVYVLGEMSRDVVTVTGMLRSIYSGEETYYEPIRLHLFKQDSGAAEIVRNQFSLIPLLCRELVETPQGRKLAEGEWHLLGKRYQYLSTPMTTKELSLATSLPRRDVPGLRFVKTAVRFANNPAEVDNNDKISLGHIVDAGVIQGTTYDIDVNSLVRHALVAGATGSGKSTTCKRILNEVIRRDVPIMVIEPAKDDYVRWALEMNKHLPPEKQFTIYMPGVTSFDGHPVEQLCINPFEAAGIPGARVDLAQHAENFVTLLNACLPAEDVIPILIEEAALNTIRDFTFVIGRDYDAGAVEPLDFYPAITEMRDQVNRIMRAKSYSGENKDNLTEILITRFNYLSRGTRGKVLNVRKSVNFSRLFSSNVIINISRLAGSKDKALIMSLLMQALYEYRVSCYQEDAEYRKSAQQNKLMHLALIEEAHNVLLKPEKNSISGNPQQAAADLFGNMLSEVRGYGQGLLVVDQVPTRLIDDAIKNTNYKIVHRLTAPDDQEVMASCMAFRSEQKAIIPALEKGNTVICGDEDDAAAWVRIERS